MSNLAQKVEGQLVSLGSFLWQSEWYGRENELVNLFAHSFLSHSIPIAQIGIEVAVKQLPTLDGKVLVRKDLVVWSTPNQTVWERGLPANDPIVIIEFKVHAWEKCERDLEWLTSYTKLYPQVTGFSVCGFVKRPRGVKFARIEGGRIAAQQVAPPVA